jgi:hypothetical protein
MNLEDLKPGDIVCANRQLFSIKIGEIAVVISVSNFPCEYTGSFGFDGSASQYTCHLEVLLLSKIRSMDVWANQWKKIEYTP